MKVIQIDNYGSSDALKYEDQMIPIFNDDEVLVKIHATSVNHLEIMQASGKMKENNPLQFPWIPGYDFAGVIERKGDNITEFEIGEKVYGNTMGGSYAEYLVASPDKMAKMPENLSFPEAATVPHVGETAWQAIHKHGQLKQGQKVLIQGAAGAVGAFAVQFAKIQGATVYATASFDDKAYLENLKADVIIDYKSTDFAAVAKDMDLVIDLVGGDTQKRSYPIIKAGGRLVTTVGIADENEAKKYDITVIPMVIEQSEKDLEQISELIEAGKIKCDVEIVYFLSDAATAWDVMNGTDPALPHVSHGKIVLEIKENKHLEEEKPIESHIDTCENCY